MEKARLNRIVQYTGNVTVMNKLIWIRDYTKFPKARAVVHFATYGVVYHPRWGTATFKSVCDNIDKLPLSPRIRKKRARIRFKAQQQTTLNNWIRQGLIKPKRVRPPKPLMPPKGM